MLDSDVHGMKSSEVRCGANAIWIKPRFYLKATLVRLFDCERQWVIAFQTLNHRTQMYKQNEQIPTSNCDGFFIFDGERKQHHSMKTRSIAKVLLLAIHQAYIFVNLPSLLSHPTRGKVVSPSPYLDLFLGHLLRIETMAQSQICISCRTQALLATVRYWR